VLRFRILWLLRCWFYLFEAPVHANILQMAAAALSARSGSDCVVQMEAVMLLHTGIEHLAFTAGT